MIWHCLCQNAMYPVGIFCFKSVMLCHLGLVLICFSALRQYQDFLEDLEEDEHLRKNVNIYRGEQLDPAPFLLHQYPKRIHPVCWYIYISLVRLRHFCFLQSTLAEVADGNCSTQLIIADVGQLMKRGSCLNFRCIKDPSGERHRWWWSTPHLPGGDAGGAQPIRCHRRRRCWHDDRLTRHHPVHVELTADLSKRRSTGDTVVQFQTNSFEVIKDW